MIKRIYLEITNACNLNCPFCSNEKGQSFMSIDEIKETLKQIKEVTDYVYLHVLGEPMLHPSFEEILNETDRLNLNVQLVTNGTLLHNYPNLLTHSSIRKLSISLHSINNIEVDNNYFNNINNLLETNTKTNIELRFYNNDHLDNKLQNYLESLKQKYGFSITPKTNSYRLKDNVYVYFSELFKWPSIEDPELSLSGKCHGAIDQIAILHNLKVTICCLDSNGYNEIGDLKKDSLKQILNSDRYKEICNNFKNNKLSFDLCKKCSYRLRFK